MTATVIIYRIDTTYTGSWGGTNYQAGYFIHVQFDTVTKALAVKVKTSSDPTASDLYSPTTGPNLFFGYDGAVTRIYPGNISDLYKACDGTALDSIGTTSTFPYGTYSVSSNHPSCYVAPVCDLEISSTYSVTKASGPSTADGSFTVSATSSNGTPKFSLNSSFDYTTDGTASPATFSSRFAGTYTVYCKDSLGCLDTIIIEIGVSTTYGVRWRLEYDDDLNANTSRIDILERDYSGSVTEIKGAGNPFELEYKGDINNPYKAIVPSVATIGLMCTSSGQFEDIFTSDDRKYLVKFYKNTGSGLTLKWTGYCIPELYEEPYLFEPFPLTINATDGLAELSSQDFLDENENRYKGNLSSLSIIASALKTTGLEINIRSAVNIFDASMNTTVDDDPLDQAYVDTRIFYNDQKEPLDLNFVVTAVLEPFGARLFQSQGVWWIQRIEYSVTTNVIYREYDFEGTYITNDTLNPILYLKASDQTNRVCWRDSSQRRGFNPQYGTFVITHNLAFDGNIIDEGGFEEEDLETDSDGNQFFKNWRFLIGQTSETFGFEALPDGTGCFFTKFSEFTNTQNDSKLYTIDIPISVLGGTFGVGDYFKIQFDVNVIPYNNVPWIRMAWQLRFTNNTTGDYYEMRPAFGDRQDYEINEEVINEIYIEEYNTFKTKDLGFFVPPVTADDATIRFTLRFHNHYGRDYSGDRTVDADYNGMRALATVDLPTDYRLYFGDTAVVSTSYYKLVGTSDAESRPEVIEQDDYNSMTNPRKWVLQEDIFIGYGTSLVQKIQFDNVQIAFFPFISDVNGSGNIKPPEKVTHEREVNSLVKPKFEKPIYLGDVPVFNNAHLVYKGFFKLSDDSPTTLWTRQGVTESRELLEILLGDYSAQMSLPVRKLTGAMLTDTFIDYINFVSDVRDDNRYINTYFFMSDFACSYNMNLINVVAGEGDQEPPAEAGEFSANEFNSEYNIGD